jgi:alpha(1,3/1,4) fucosyltransferase
MKTLKLDFVDFSPRFQKENNFIYNNLKQRYNIEISSDPDYLFFSCYGNENLKYDCIKIYYTGENLVPDFNICDYAIGFHYIDFEDRYIRVPLSHIRKEYKESLTKNFDKEKVVNRKFCNFVYSNQGNAHPMRNMFYEELSKYKKIDSGGPLFNNIGGCVDDKLEFVSEYKFTVAIENSSVIGYTTEKIVDPMSVNSIPIYWGNAKVGLDFNPESFIYIKDDSDEAINEAIERIKFLDNNDDEYLNMLSKPWILPEQVVDIDKTFQEFFDNIFTQDYEKAWRRALNGFNMRHVERMIKLAESEKNPNLGFKDIGKIIAKKIVKK